MKYKYKELKKFKKEYKESLYRSKIDELIESIDKDGLLNGLGKPEFLKYIKVYSRRITDQDRLLYKMLDDMETIVLISCKGHY